MSRRNGFPGALLPPSARLIAGIILLALAVGLLGGAPTIALRAHSGVVAEFGRTAARLVTTGKIFALLAATLVFLQFILGAKLKVLDRVFGLHRLLLGHRFLGVSGVILVSLHPLFVFAPKAREIGALRIEIFPELLGAALLIGLWTGVCTGLWREFLHLRYQVWYRFHRLGMFSAVVLVTLHVLNVTDDLVEGWPLYALLTAFGVYATVFFWAKVIKPRLLKRRTHAVTKVTPAGKDTYAVELSPEDDGVFSYAPGQFAFVTFHSEALPLERHPWTISSAPTRPGSLVFIIKCSGDFTAHIGKLKPGDTAVVDGPYGLFSYPAYVQDPNAELVMVSGGVGVTPMLSMLRYMADRGDSRKVTLVWSNRTEADILCRDEFEAIEAKLSNLSVHHVLTRQKDFQGPTSRLDAAMLKELLSESDRDAAVFVCGPPPMMNAVCKALKGIGFRARRIHTERFSI
ncbi:MAG: ferric reductase-like transmembrane domain-containing protein [Thermodesulfobacteriota bacterium]